MKITWADLGASVGVEIDGVKECIVGDYHCDFVDTESYDGGLYIIVT